MRRLALALAALLSAAPVARAAEVAPTPPIGSLGLKFGLHIVRGVPKPAVKGNLPIAGSAFHAADAADPAATCPWDDARAPASTKASFVAPAHGVALYRLE